jgi:arylsulfatase A-like enzyme
MPHIRLEVSEQFRGKSAGGIYGDVVGEIDWNVGRILQTLKDEGLDGRTYVIFTSDNGPWFLGRSKGHLKRIGKDAEAHGGSAAPLRGAKTSLWEGGVRVPCIIRAPGRIPAGAECAELASTLDMLPTLAALAGGKVPRDRVIDGHDISDLVHGIAGAKSPTAVLHHYARTRLGAVRSGPWKLHLPRPVDAKWQHYSKEADAIEIPQPMLFDLRADPGETTDVAARHPEVVARLMEAAGRARTDIGDHDRIGQNARFFDPQPRRPDILQKK